MTAAGTTTSARAFDSRARASASSSASATVRVRRGSRAQVRSSDSALEQRAAKLSPPQSRHAVMRVVALMQRYAATSPSPQIFTALRSRSLHRQAHEVGGGRFGDGRCVGDVLAIRGWWCRGPIVNRRRHALGASARTSRSRRVRAPCTERRRRATGRPARATTRARAEPRSKRSRFPRASRDPVETLELRHTNEHCSCPMRPAMRARVVIALRLSVDADLAQRLREIVVVDEDRAAVAVAAERLAGKKLVQPIVDRLQLLRPL